MKISIITTSFNSEETIKDTIESVLFQTYGNMEYIIIDGGSHDKTLKIIDGFKDKGIGVISETDNGIYDAMNKGIELATGDIIGILNSDDFYFNSDVLQKVADCFAREDVDACYGDIIYVGKKNKNKIVRRWKAGEYHEKNLDRGWIPPHPAFFVKRRVYQQCGVFRQDLSIAADYELMLRFFKICKIKVAYISETFVFMRSGGYSSKNIFTRLVAIKEWYRAWQLNGLKPPLFLFITRPILKLRQFLCPVI